MDNATTLAVLRTIDKTDRLGVKGVVAKLQEPMETFGAGLDPVRAGLIGQFLEARGATNEETIARLRGFMAHANRVGTRLRLLEVMEGTIQPDGTTGLDALLAMPANEDQTWNGGGRPANIGWALDDIAQTLAKAEG